MAELQYVDMILNGFFTDESLLQSYLLKKQKEVKRDNFVTESEFIKRCYNVILLFENDIEHQYLERKEESEFIEKPSREHFFIQLSSFTDDKFKGELWNSQIQFIKKCIDEISNHNIIIDIAIKDLEIENYLDFIVSQKEISRETKENAVQVLMEQNKQEKSTYDVWHDYVFNQQHYWKEITLEERKLFEELRTKSFEEMNTLFLNIIKGSPKPRAVVKKEFEMVIIDRLSKEPFQKTTTDFMEGLLPQDLNNLAIIIGKIDFLKKIHKPKAEKLPEKWHALLYWFELKISGEKPPIDVEGAFIKSEIAKIGALRCNSTGLSFYYAFKDIWSDNNLSLNTTFGIEWKELVIKMSNNNPEIIKYIDENY